MDLETDELLLELDIDTTYRIDKIRGEEKEAYLKFERPVYTVYHSLISPTIYIKCI